MTERTALLLIGYQNDYFADDGILRSFLEETEQRSQLVQRTTDLVRELASSDILMISTPICFTADYSELVDPTGILAAIRDVGAFKADTRGSETVPELVVFGDRIEEIPGKRGLNAFSNTLLQQRLEDANITRLVLAGAVTSICIDSTGRAATDRGFSVSILSDCTAGRTEFEQQYFCDHIFTLYADVLTSEQFISRARAAG